MQQGLKFTLKLDLKLELKSTGNCNEKWLTGIELKSQQLEYCYLTPYVWDHGTFVTQTTQKSMSAQLCCGLITLSANLLTTCSFVLVCNKQQQPNQE